MKKVLLSIFAVAAFAMTVNAQSIIDAEDGSNPNDFYQKGIVIGKRAMPYANLRESDVVWKMLVYRHIDLNENFNQFFYYPIEQGKNEQGRINLVNLIMTAAANGEFDVYEDDDMKVPQEWSKAIANLQGRQLKVRYGEEDEFGDQEVFNDTIPEDFDPATARLIKLKEYWYIDKQDSRQKVRITGLAFRFSKNILRSVEFLLAKDRDSEKRIVKSCRQRTVDYVRKAVVFRQTFLELLAAPAVMGNKINILVLLKKRRELLCPARIVISRKARNCMRFAARQAVSGGLEH